MVEYVVIVGIILMVLTIGILPPLLDIKIQEKKEKDQILAVQRREEKIEKDRVRRVKRLARQREIGDRLYWSLVEKAPPDRKIWRIRENFAGGEEENYLIGIGGDITITIDLKLIGREISVSLPANLGGGRQFSLANGEGWIKNKLVELIGK